MRHQPDFGWRRNGRPGLNTPNEVAAVNANTHTVGWGGRRSSTHERSLARTPFRRASGSLGGLAEIDKGRRRGATVITTGELDASPDGYRNSSPTWSGSTSSRPRVNRRSSKPQPGYRTRGSKSVRCLRLRSWCQRSTPERGRSDRHRVEAGGIAEQSGQSNTMCAVSSAFRTPSGKRRRDAVARPAPAADDRVVSGTSVSDMSVPPDEGPPSPNRSRRCGGALEDGLLADAFGRIAQG